MQRRVIPSWFNLRRDNRTPEKLEKLSPKVSMVHTLALFRLPLSFVHTRCTAIPLTERGPAAQQGAEAAASQGQQRALRGRRRRLETRDRGLSPRGRRVARVARVDVIPQGLVSETQLTQYKRIRLPACPPSAGARS